MGDRRPGKYEYAWLAAIVLIGFGLRLWAINAAVAGGVLADPDGYVAFARTLGDGVRPWHWTFDSVRYLQFFKAPLYQLALSVLTTNGLSVVTWGLTAHAVLNSCSIAFIYAIGRSLHTSRAGLVAAAMYALWIPNIRLTETFWQEHLYIPLLLAGFALLAHAIERPERVRLWLAAGTVFGAAALTRSSVLYYLPLAVVWLWFSLRDSTSRRAVAGFVAAMLLVTLPYVIALRQEVRRLVPIEDIGSFSLRFWYPVSPADSSITLDRYAPNKAIAPTGLQTARFLAADFSASPSGFVARRIDVARLLLKPAGGSVVTASVTPNRDAAQWLKLRTHLTMDLPFVTVLILAPIGFAVSRQRIVGGLLLMWILQIGFLQALTMWAGLRYRAPMEPAAILLASVALAGAWVRPRRSVFLVAVVLFAGVAASLVENGGPLLRTRSSYGVEAWPPAPGATVTFTGAAGVRAGLDGDELGLRVEARDAGDTRLTVRVNNRVVDSVSLQAGQGRVLTYRDAQASEGYVELEARSANGQPALVVLGVR